MISGKTAVFGIFGHPVEHSFSPEMHNAAFRKVGLNACYVPFAVPPAGLRDAVRAIVPMGLRGVNITVPHKEKIIPFLDGLKNDARLIGAVNTIEVAGDRLIGHNTDGRGFLRSLREETAFRPKGKRVILVGSGGAARAVAFNLALAGAEEVMLHDIDVPKAKRLALALRKTTAVAARAISAGELRTRAGDVHCLINATPLGLKPGDPLPMDPQCIQKGQLVCDLVYNRPMTPLLKAAGKVGACTLSGLGMLLYQGVIAFEIWTKKKAPAAVMRSALVRQLRGRRK